MKKKTFLLLIIFLLIDIITKLIVNHYLELMQSIVLIKNFFSLTKVYNYGASWSILTGQRWFLIILAIVILCGLIKYQTKFKENKRNMVTFSLIYAGIIGNLIDRVIYGYVIDFFNFNIFGYDYPIFNMADIFIVIGVLLLMYAIIKKEDVK